MAASLAGEVFSGALIVESSFTSLYDVAKSLYPYLPVRLFLPQDYDPSPLCAAKAFLCLPRIALRGRGIGGL